MIDQAPEQEQPVSVWYIEIWLEIRDRFKAVVGDAFLFIVVLLILELVSLILARMDYPESRKRILETTHFGGSYSVLLVLIIDLVLKIILTTWRQR